jgi:Tfp pilus assembly protein PilN
MKAVNLLPQDGRRRPAGEGAGKSAYVVCGLLALMLVMVAAYVLTANNITERKSQAAAAGAEADRLEAEVAAQSNYTSFADIAQQRLTSVTGVAQTRFDWERLMREVSHVIPEGSWLQATDAAVTGDPDATAVSPAPGAVATPAGPYASFVGCTPNQSDVAQIMVRLRHLHRVEDVKLKESTKEPGGGEATVDNCGSLYKFDVAVTFSPIGPPSEAPRGSGSVPASLGGGS